MHFPGFGKKQNEQKTKIKMNKILLAGTVLLLGGRTLLRRQRDEGLGVNLKKSFNRNLLEKMQVFYVWFSVLLYAVQSKNFVHNCQIKFG
jgi:hypothetical protein